MGRRWRCDKGQIAAASTLELAMDGGLVALLVLLPLLVVLIACCCARAWCAASWRQLVEALTCGWCGRERPEVRKSTNGRLGRADSLPPPLQQSSSQQSSSQQLPPQQPLPQQLPSPAGWPRVVRELVGNGRRLRQSRSASAQVASIVINFRPNGDLEQEPAGAPERTLLRP